MSTREYRRQPDGIPAGGQFASVPRSEATGVVLGQGSQNESGAVPANGMPVLGTAANGYQDWVDEDGHLVKQVRFDGVKPNDAPDGTAAVILYRESLTSERFYRNGVVHDGSGEAPTRRVTKTDGTISVYRGVRVPHRDVWEQESPDGQPSRVEISPDGELKTVWMASGHYQDPAPGVPAVTVKKADGSVVHVHTPYGVAQDLDDGTPAQREWNKDGQLVLEVRHYSGFVMDADDGIPAIREFYPDGTLKAERRYWMNKVAPGPNGEPSIVEYNPDGSVASTQYQGSVEYSAWGDRVKRTTRAGDVSYARYEPGQGS